MIAASPGRAEEELRPDGELPAIDVRGLSKRYGTLEAIRGISFEVGRGEIFGLIGPDGAGKPQHSRFLRV